MSWRVLRKNWVPKHAHWMGCFPPSIQSRSQTNSGQKGTSGGLSPYLHVKAGPVSRLDQIAADLIPFTSENLHKGEVTGSLGQVPVMPYCCKYSMSNVFPFASSDCCSLLFLCAPLRKASLHVLYDLPLNSLSPLNRPV